MVNNSDFTKLNHITESPTGSPVRTFSSASTSKGQEREANTGICKQIYTTQTPVTWKGSQPTATEATVPPSVTISRKVGRNQANNNRKTHTGSSRLIISWRLSHRASFFLPAKRLAILQDYLYL